MRLIKIVFLYQVASFWPNWDSLYRSCVQDKRIDVRLILLNESGTEKTQMQTAEKFLVDNHLSYTVFEDIDIEIYSPDYVIYQTPYLEHRRGNIESWSANMIRLGARIVYIPYGIEIADNNDADYVHFKQKLILNCFRIYTFSDEMKKIYEKRCYNHKAVRALGMPKFDGIYYRDRFKLEESIAKKVNGRKIILWKMHFVKHMFKNGKQIQMSPDIYEYKKFAEAIREYSDLFFIFMPHPKIRECEPLSLLIINRIFECIENSENAVVDLSDDYRNSLVNANAIIVDRSSLMIEAAAVGCPVMYIKNKDFDEPFNEPINRMIETYYTGSTFEDIKRYINMIREGIDPKKHIRDQEFERTIPNFDGHCGERIKEDLIESLKEPYNNHLLHYDFNNKRIAIWGTGFIASKLYWFLLLGEKCGRFYICAYIDNNKEKIGTVFQGKAVVGAEYAKTKEYDYILLAVDGKEGEIREQLREMGIIEDNVVNYDRFLISELIEG